MDSFKYYLHTNGELIESYIEIKVIDGSFVLKWDMSYYRYDDRKPHYVAHVHKDSKPDKFAQYIKDYTKKDSDFKRTVLPTMKLDLSVFQYKDTKPSDIIILNKDSKLVKHNEGDGYYSVESVNGDELLFTDDTEVFCNKKAKIYKVYERDKVKDLSKEDPMEALYYTDNGFLSFDYLNHHILSHHNKLTKDRSYEYFYKKNNGSLPIYALSNKLYEVYESYSTDVEDYIRRYIVLYDENSMVRDVRITYSKDNKCPTSFCKYHVKDENNIIYIYSIYPTGLSDNIDNYKYHYGQLWNYDKMAIDKDKAGIISLARYTYLIDEDMEDFAKGLKEIEFKEGKDQ